jgi:hypothetical protein
MPDKNLKNNARYNDVRKHISIYMYDKMSAYMSARIPGRMPNRMPKYVRIYVR